MTAQGRKSGVMGSSSPLKKSPELKKASSSTSKKSSTVSTAFSSNGELLLSRVVEEMFDKICPMNLAASEGIGADNMTCVIIEFQKPEQH